MVEFTANSLEEYQRICESLRNRDDGKQVFFRGQVHGYEPQSSEERPTKDNDDRVIRDLLREAWEMTAVATLARAGSRSLNTAAVMGVLQHYGFRSWFIDITDDEMVGLWFARHKYTPVGGVAPRPPAVADEGSPDGGHAHIDLSELLVFEAVRHEPVVADSDGKVAPGLVFVFAVNSDSQHLLDLRSNVPEAALRVHRQSGSGLLPDNGSYEPFLLARITVTFPAPAELYSGSTLLSTAELFPGPDEDDFYKHLLRTPRLPNNASKPASPGQSPEGAASPVRHRLFADPLGIPLYESPGTVDHIPLLWAHAVDNYTTVCLACIGLAEVTVDMPFTTRGGARGSRFTAKEVFGETCIEAPIEHVAGQDGDGSEHSGGAHRPGHEDHGLASGPAESSGPHGARRLTVPFANWPAESRMFLRIPVLSNLPEFVSSESPFPVLRGFIVQGHADRIEVWSVSELVDGAISLWPPTTEPGLSYPWPLELEAFADKLETAVAEELDFVLFGVRLADYFNALDRGEAELFWTAGRHHHFDFYWVNPGGVVPIGSRWVPPATP
ncbi:FRG domain-containing protein [Streptomyces sp. NPDC056401]|uniref:FRG domain-containing protein n=1 Tax=Streptomyces sp. NPDC056401 TaxID=3345809 RepID=UPI0035DA21DD